MRCGVGDWSLAYLTLAQKVVGVDINPQFIEKAKREAAALGDDGQVEFYACDLLEFDDFEGADLVCLGSCLQYLSENEIENIFTKITRSLKRGDRLYIRATVVNRFRRPYQNAYGFYRKREYYEGCFRRFGWKTLASESSAGLVLGQWMPRRLAACLEFPFRVLKALWRETDFYNWFLQRG